MHQAGDGGDISHTEQGTEASVLPRVHTTHPPAVVLLKKKECDHGNDLGISDMNRPLWPKKTHQNTQVYFLTAQHHPYSSLMRGHRHLHLSAPCTPACLTFTHTATQMCGAGLMVCSLDFFLPSENKPSTPFPSWQNCHGCDQLSRYLLSGTQTFYWRRI